LLTWVNPSFASEACQTEEKLPFLAVVFLAAVLTAGFLRPMRGGGGGGVDRDMFKSWQKTAGWQRLDGTRAAVFQGTVYQFQWSIVPSGVFFGGHPRPDQVYPDLTSPL
jgi:hypothetical protein